MNRRGFLKGAVSAAAGTPFWMGGLAGNLWGKLPSDIKITEVRPIFVGSTLYVKIFTNKGVTGLGASSLATWVGDTPTITQQGWFPLQPRDRIGNMTANNPKMRNFPRYNENISLAKTFSILSDNRMQLDARLEAFNMFNRVIFSTPDTGMSGANFGFVNNQSNAPRKVQLALKLMW